MPKLNLYIAKLTNPLTKLIEMRVRGAAGAHLAYEALSY
jgi:hypothetical protein